MKHTSIIKTFFVAAIIVSTTSAIRAETLKEALAATYVNNPQIAAALLSVKASAEDIAIRRGQSEILPSISASADVSTSWTSVNGNVITPSSGSIGVAYRQTLFDNLKTDAQLEQARAYVEVSSQALRSAIQDVFLSSASSYLDVVRETSLVKLRAENVAFYQAQVSSAKDRLNIGTGTKTAVSQAQARLAQGVASYKNAINNLKSAQASYQRWVGHKPQNLSLSYNFGSILPRSMDEAQSLADQFHPAILTAKAQLRASQSASDAAKAAFGPTLRLIGNIKSSTNFVSGVSTPTASIALSLSIPIYQGGALTASVRKANINQIKSEIDVLNARDRIRASVVSSWSGVANANAQIEAASSSVYSSNQVLQGVIEERNVGQRTTLDVLNARAELTTAKENEISARVNKILASFSLIAASGRLSVGDLGLPVQIRTSDGVINNVDDIWQDLRSLSN